jgi:MFS transporter, YNFM family, putative membrane transport protein
MPTASRQHTRLRHWQTWPTLEGRSSAVGLYVTSFYTGGSVGAFLPGLAWNAGGWPACVAMAVAMVAAMALIATLAYARAAE